MKIAKVMGTIPSRLWAFLGIVAVGVVCTRLAGGDLRCHRALAAGDTAGAVIRNGGMEDPFVGGIAHGWQNNFWGDIVGSLSPETSQVHSGRAAQHVHCERVTAGAAQICQQGIAVHSGQLYTLTLWLRGNVDGPVFVGIRQNPPPYHRYLAQSVRVTPEWRPYVISGTVTADGPDAGLYIAFSVPGDLWIDDVEFREGAPAVAPAQITSRAPERKGNLLYNSGFELGPDGWGPVPRLQIDAHGAAQGRACAQCTPTWEPILLESRPVVIRPGQRYTISASLRAAGIAEVEMVVMEYADDGSDQPGQRDTLRRTFRIGRQWQRVSLTGVLRAPLVNGYVLQLNHRAGARTVWADALQWEEGGLSAYRPAMPVETAVRAPVRLLTPGQRAVTECRIYRSPAARFPGTVTCRLEDTEGHPVAQQSLRYSAAGGQWTVTGTDTPRLPAVASPAHLSSPLQTMRLTWRLPAPGIYRVVASTPDTPVHRTGQAVFCLLAGDLRTARRSRFGLQGWSDPSSPDRAMKAANYLGAGGFRLHDFRNFVQWYEVEPTAGRYHWFDPQVDDLARHGYQMLGTLCRTPLWAAREGAEHLRHSNWCSSPPRDRGEWTRYVEAVVRHYRDRVQAWEIWNEPWSANFWTGTPEEYVQLLAAGHGAVKAADPKAMVVGGCFSPAFPRFTQSVLQAGGLRYMDVLSYHEYMQPANVAEPADGGQPALYRSAAALREAIERRGGHQPLWCTETGVICPSAYSWLPVQGPHFSGRIAAGTLVKGMTLLLAAGVEHVYYYYIGSLQGGSGYPSRILSSASALLDYDGAPKPTLPALAQAMAMLGDAGEPSDLSTPTLRAYAFRRGAAEAARPAQPEQQFVAVVWSRGGAEALQRPAVTTARGLSARDVMGAPLAFPVTLDDRPVYLLADSRESLAQALGPR